MRVIKRLNDNQFENKGYNHVRNVVRGIIYNDNHEIALIYLLGDDIFGHRDYYETPGGGQKPHETLKQTLIREINEEIGASIDQIVPLGRIIDYYNLISRKNDNHYFLAHAVSVDESKCHREPFEKTFFNKVVWVPIDQAIDLYNSKEDTKISILVKNREIPVIREAIKYFTK